MIQCLICEGNTHTLHDDEIKVTYHVCEKCGYTFKDSLDHPTHDDEHALYKNHQNTMENTGYVNMFERFLASTVDPYLSEGKALDFGSGPGPVLYELLKRRGFDAAHYDPYFKPDKTVFDNTYALITSTEVFEHLSDPVMEFKRLAGMLKPEGYLTIMTSLRPKEDDAFLTWWYRRDQTHIGFFTEEAFDILSKKAELSFVYTNHKNYFLFKKESE